MFELYIKDRRLISVNKCIVGLGEQKARALLGLHVLSGCDQVGKMATITKARVVKFFMQLWNLFVTCHYLLKEKSSIPDSASLQTTMQLYSSHHDSSVSDIGLRYLTLDYHLHGVL